MHSTTLLDGGLVTTAVLITIGYVLFLWWFSTGALFLLVNRATHSHFTAITGMSVVSVTAIAGLVMTLDTATVEGAIIGFTCAITIWAWHELTFLTGVVAGRTSDPCPPDAKGFRRFRAAFLAIRDHEIALFATLIALAILSAGAANPFGLYTFALLWVMRLSAKLNLFFGVPFVAAEIMPQPLRYLVSYFRVDRPTVFFFASVGVSIAAFASLFTIAAGSNSPHIAIGTAAIASLLALAIAEHLFMVVPVHKTRLWSLLFPNAPKAEEADAPLTYRKDPLDYEKSILNYSNVMRPSASLPSAQHIPTTSRRRAKQMQA